MTADKTADQTADQTAGQTAGLSDTFKNAAKGALLEGADIEILKVAVQGDAKRDEKYSEIENSAQETAKKAYKARQTDKRLVKAALIPRTGEKASAMYFMFNPTDLSLSRGINITAMNGARTERGLPKVNFGFVEPYKLTLAGILFDTYETGTNVLTTIKPLLDAVDFSKFQDPFNELKINDSSYQERVVKVGLLANSMSKFVEKVGAKNVLGVIEYGVENLAQQSLELRRPPVFYFIWGEKNYMCCMIKQLDYKLTMFLPNGTPVRAVVTITLEEVDLGVASRAFSQRQKFITD